MAIQTLRGLPTTIDWNIFCWRPSAAQYHRPRHGLLPYMFEGVKHPVSHVESAHPPCRRTQQYSRRVIGALAEDRCQDFPGSVQAEREDNVLLQGLRISTRVYNVRHGLGLRSRRCGSSSHKMRNGVALLRVVALLNRA